MMSCLYLMSTMDSSRDESNQDHHEFDFETVGDLQFQNEFVSKYECIYICLYTCKLTQIHTHARKYTHVWTQQISNCCWSRPISGPKFVLLPSSKIVSIFNYILFSLTYIYIEYVHNIISLFITKY